jgi:hypothetical protein
LPKFPPKLIVAGPLVKLVHPLIPGLSPTLLLLPQANPTIIVTVKANPEMSCFMESPQSNGKSYDGSREAMPGPHFRKSIARCTACRPLMAIYTPCPRKALAKFKFPLASDSVAELWAERKNLVEAMQQLARCGVPVPGPPAPTD